MPVGEIFPDTRGKHLRALSETASRVDSPLYSQAWSHT